MPLPEDINVHNEADPSGKLIEYLRAVKYKPNMDPVNFRKAISAGDRETVCAVFSWLLPQLHILQKRAMVGFYLTMPEVPVELRTVQVSFPAAVPASAGGLHACVEQCSVMSSLEHHLRCIPVSTGVVRVATWRVAQAVLAGHFHQNGGDTSSTR
jgi:Intraflagellar transport 81 calponin homology domain